MNRQGEVVSVETLQFAYREWIPMMRRNRYTDEQIFRRVHGFAPGMVKDEIIEALVKGIPGHWAPEVAKKWEEYFRSL